ncbi:hypothetical protein CTI12_AA129950 [Artemisia annua]|uniref:Uncharacterized protein n=1 Tax=Artemisia annua TaxID=35608 RepID=A0A2U1NWB2_ARTAN|nr:hypothetical protein CTI12_AA129950 [Artemisia annua]
MAEVNVELGTVDIDHTVQLLLDYEERVHNRSKHHPQSIFMVPSIYRDISPSSYTPRVVSVGPLHHQDEHLKGFEVYKATYMHELLHSLHSTPEETLKACVTKITNSIDQIKACYIGMKTYPDSELVEMMVMDACFILAFLNYQGVSDSSMGLNSLLYPHIFYDMVLIENQIPFFVLQDIFNSTLLKLYPTLSLSYYIFKVQKHCKVFEEDLEMNSSNISSTHDHILGFLHKSYQHPDSNSSKPFSMDKAYSVTELDRSGVRFSYTLNAKWPMAIELEFSRFLCIPLSWRKPTLKMPVLYLHAYTELILRNLLIYEHSSQVKTCVSSYLIALDLLINTPEDVAKLASSQVLVNTLGSEEKAVNLISSIHKDVPVADFFYHEQWKLLDKYYNGYWPNILAELRRSNFSNPWSIIALLAGIALFILTVVQTIYGVKAA